MLRSAMTRGKYLDRSNAVNDAVAVMPSGVRKHGAFIQSGFHAFLKFACLYGCIDAVTNGLIISKVQLDLDTIRIEEKELVKPLVADHALVKRNITRT